MQKIERILGFQVKVSGYLPGARLTNLGEEFVKGARKHGLDPDDYCVYVHNLSVIVTDPPPFLKRTKLRDRVDSVVIGFFVNQKQQRSRKLLFANHHFRGLVQPDHQYADYFWIQYTIEAHELEALGTFSNQLITFVHHSLPKKHRKIKVAIMARPTERLPSTLRKNVTTKLDLRYERFTQFQLLKQQKRTMSTGHSVVAPSLDFEQVTTVTFNAQKMVFGKEEVNMSKYEFHEKISNAAIGDHAQFIQNATGMSAHELANALESIQPAIAGRAKAPVEQNDSKTIGDAITAAKSGDKEGALGHLKKVGAWGWGVIKELSASVTVEALKQLIGAPQ